MIWFCKEFDIILWYYVASYIKLCFVVKQIPIADYVSLSTVVLNSRD